MLDLLRTDRAAAVSTDAGGAPLKGMSGYSVMLPLRKIADNPYQPRDYYDAEHILNLALSIKRLKDELPATRGLQQIPMARVGIMQPDGEFDIAARHMYANTQALALLQKEKALVQLMFGHSRLRAFMVLAEGLRALRDGSGIGMNFSAVAELEARYADLLEADFDYAEMPIAVGFALDHQMWAHAITENSQRKNITAIEEAQSIRRAVEEFGLTAEEAGRPFGYARSTTANKMRLLQLPPSARAAIADGRLTERHGRELLRLVEDSERLDQALSQALEKAWTVRQLTENVKWIEESMRMDQARRRELEYARRVLVAGWCLPGQSEPVPVEKLDAGENYAVAFDAGDRRDRELIEDGHCGPACACFKVTYQHWRVDSGYKIDPDNAPHVVAACDDHACMRARRESLSPEEAAEQAERDRKKNEEATRLSKEAHALWQRWLGTIDLQEVWGDIRFWREATFYTATCEILGKCEGPHDATQELLRMFYRRTRKYILELGTEAHCPADVERLIARLGGTVSRETGEV